MSLQAISPLLLDAANSVGFDVAALMNSRQRSIRGANRQRRYAIDYDGEHAPVVALRVQEVFGMTRAPDFG